MTSCRICGAWTRLLYTVHPDTGTRLCATCTRFARKAGARGYEDWVDASIRMERAMLDGKPGFLEPEWTPEEIACLDKQYTLSEIRRRSIWLSLSRSFGRRSPLHPSMPSHRRSTEPSRLERQLAINVTQKDIALNAVIEHAGTLARRPNRTTSYDRGYAQACADIAAWCRSNLGWNSTIIPPEDTPRDAKRTAERIPDPTGADRALYRLHPTLNHEGLLVTTVEIVKEWNPSHTAVETAVREAESGRVLRKWHGGIGEDTALATLRYALRRRP